MSNAVKFTAEHGVVRLKAVQKELLTKELKLVISVSDTGIGMSKEFMDRIYEPFSQEHPNREGTGLGLSIANQLVTLMGGTIACSSELGQGTTFTVEVTLPLADAVEEIETEKKKEYHYTEDEIDQILSGKRVLLCEDHPLNRQIACGLLEREHVQVETAENGQIGLEMFLQSSVGYYDAILMDIRMPVMDGIEAARKIRALNKEDAKTIPILAMTANAFQDDMDATAAAGMNEHLSKPIEPQKLYQALTHHVKVSSTHSTIYNQ